MRRNTKHVFMLCPLILILLLTSCAIDDWSNPAEWAPNSNRSMEENYADTGRKDAPWRAL